MNFFVALLSKQSDTLSTTLTSFSLTSEQPLPTLGPGIPVLCGQYANRILTRVRGHLNDAVQLFNNVTRWCYSQSTVRTHIQHIQLEKLGKTLICRHYIMWASGIMHTRTCIKRTLKAGSQRNARPLRSIALSLRLAKISCFRPKFCDQMHERNARIWSKSIPAFHCMASSVQWCTGDVMQHNILHHLVNQA